MAQLLDRLGACEAALVGVLELASRSLSGLAASESPAEIEAVNVSLIAALARVHKDVGGAILAIADAKKEAAAAGAGAEPRADGAAGPMGAGQ